MTTSRPEPENVDHLVDVLQGLIALLTQYGETARADWLTERMAVVAASPSSQAAIAEAIRDLHQTVLGMGGLTDLHLRSESREKAKEATVELRRLADQLYELTR